MPPCVLVADDESFIRDILARALRQMGLEALTASSGEEAVELYLLHREEVALVLLDLHMPGEGGAAALAAMRQLSPALPVLLITGAAEEVARLGAGGVLAKPLPLDELVRAVGLLLPPKP
jgi:CheY-like chemotaxis protein